MSSTTTPAQLTATYSTWAAVHRDASSLSQGLFLRISVELAQFAQVDVQIVLPDGEGIVVRGEVVSVVPQQAVALQWRPEGRDATETLLKRAMAHPADVAAAGADEPAAAERSDDTDESDSGEAAPAAVDAAADNFVDRESLQAQIEAMSVNDKRQAALHGKKDMRWLLVRDQNKTIHSFVIKNPAITVDEIEQIARLTSVNPEVLHTISQNRDWTRSQSVVRNLVKNPKTPMPDALSVLDKLPVGEIRALAKSSSVRTPIQMAARKKMNAG